jgi:hypothetical protein
MKKLKQPVWAGKYRIWVKNPAVFAGKQAVFAPYFHVPREKGTGIPPSG